MIEKQWFGCFVIRWSPKISKKTARIMGYALNSFHFPFLVTTVFFIDEGNVWYEYLINFTSAILL
jgi:hypothetical protein